MNAKALLLTVVIWIAGPTTPSLAQEPIRLAMEAFGTEAQIEVRGLEPTRAQEVIRAALTEIHTVQRLLDPAVDDPGGVGALYAGRGQKVVVDPRLVELLTRSLQYCVWSGNAFSPLGGEVERLWQIHDRTGENPHPSDLRDAVQLAECKHLLLDAGPPVRVTMPQEGSLTLSALAKGFAIDRAVEVLTSAGVDNAFVEIGHLVRGIGGGPDGNGWLVAIPGHRKTRNPLDQFWLVNQSLAVVRDDGPRRVDHRKGVPGLGVVQIAAVSELAVDTEILAHTLFVMGSPDGQRLLGYLNPRPRILWLLGTGVGTPLESYYHWSELPRPRRLGR